MSGLLTPQKTDRGWIVEVPPEMAETLGVAEGSLVALYAKEGTIEVEILPPPSPELKERVRQIHEKFKEAFEEMKRLGD
ncbi:MAG: hypothetical protein L0229_12055 [Blastocatellia bacterium]|nr:hypothetical protein [Blastocatellia bacterium]